MGAARPARGDADLAGSRLLSQDPAAESAFPRPTWSIGHALLGLLYGNAINLLALLGSLGGGGAEEGGIDVPLAALLLLNVPIWVGYLVMPYLAARRSGRGLVDEFWLRPTVRDAVVGIPVGIGTQVVAVPLLYALLFAIGDAIGWELDRDISGEAKKIVDVVNGPVDVVLLLLMVAVIAPFVEETFFRGMFLGAFQRRFGAAWGVAISALAFGAVHLQPLQFPALAMFGAILAVLVVRTGRLGAAIWAHVAFNTVSTVALLTIDDLPKRLVEVAAR